MSRNLSMMFALACLSGFGLGWLMFSTPPVVAPSVARPPETAAESLHSPAPSNRREFSLRPADVGADRETPAVAIDARGRVLLAWASQTGDLERTLTLARSLDGGQTFEGPSEWRKVPIYRYASKSKGKAKKDGHEMTFSTHALPRLVSSGDAIHLGWVEAIQGGPEVAFFVATTLDGGRTFSEPVRAHGAEAVKPGFTGMSAGPDGSVLAAWLDGRAQGQRPFVSVRKAASSSFEPEQLIFEGPDGKGVCPCCDLSVVPSAHGRFVAFRNSDSGNRDIYVSAGGSPVPVAPDHWKLDGCPHDGPSLALGRDRLSLAWMDGHTGKNRVYLATSPGSAELNFTVRELAPDSPGAQGHPKLASTASGDLVAVWDEATVEATASRSTGSPAEAGHGHASPLTGGGRTIRLATSNGDGFGPSRAIAPTPGAFQLQPALALGPDGVALVAWAELDEHGKRVVFARVPPGGPVH